MANDKIKLSPISISTLPEIDDPTDFWVFGSKEDEDGIMTSGRYSLNKVLEFAERLQLERRLSFYMETNDIEMYFDEAMTIYRIAGDNISDTTIKIGDNEYLANLDEEVSISIPAKSKVTFSVTKKLTDTKMFLFIYAKANINL